MVSFRQVLSRTGPATELGTRATLAAIMEALVGELPAEQAGIVQVVLAEILNNVVEHAYADSAGGTVEVAAFRGPAALRFVITDHGAPLPGLELPPARRADLAVPRDNLPEGGFGWLLIRSMASALDYVRDGDANVLCITFDIGGG